MTITTSYLKLPISLLSIACWTNCSFFVVDSGRHEVVCVPLSCLSLCFALFVFSLFSSFQWNHSLCFCWWITWSHSTVRFKISIPKWVRQPKTRTNIIPTSLRNSIQPNWTQNWLGNWKNSVVSCQILDVTCFLVDLIVKPCCNQVVQLAIKRKTC